jgi:hypothetical protein
VCEQRVTVRPEKRKLSEMERAFFQVKLGCVLANADTSSLSGMTLSDVNKATAEIFILLQNNAAHSHFIVERLESRRFCD